MNEKTQLINDIKCQLFEKLTPDQMNDLDKALHSRLEDYEIQKRCTDIALLDSVPVRTLQKFAISKKMEGLSDRTIRRYYKQNYILLTTINKPIEEINAFDIRAFLLNYQNTRAVSNRTLAGMRGCYSSFFGWCYKEEFIDKNPCENVAQIKYEKTIKTPFSDIEMEKIKRSCESKRDRALVEFLYATGCRVSEVVQLNIDNINFKTNTAVVLGKGGKERVVYITNVAMLYLIEYIESRSDNSPALFIGKGSERLSKNGIEAALKRIGSKAGVENVHPHRYRRTLATNLIDRGVNIQDVATVLGHEDIGTTKIYYYISQQNVSIAYNRCIS